MKQQESSEVPDSTYFRTGDAEPTIEDDGSITLYDGEGSRRSWGKPQVNTTVIVDECDFLSVLVGFSHKHGGGQFYRHYITTQDGPQRRTWGRLTYDEKVLVRQGYDDKAPYWAKSPGKLPEEHIKPKMSKFTAYKIMRQTEDSLLSLYDDTAWEIDKRNSQAVGERAGDPGWDDYIVHDGGYYVHKDADSIMALFQNRDLAPARCYDEQTMYVLVECECYGRTARFSSGKIAVTYVTPLVIVKEVKI